MFIPNFNLLCQFDGEVEEGQPFFQVKKRDPRPQFAKELSIGLNKKHFCVFGPREPPASSFGHDWILTQGHLPSYKLIRFETKPIDRIGEILVGIEQSTWFLIFYGGKKYK